MNGRKWGTPHALGAKAFRLWGETVAKYEMRPDELVLFEQACRELDLVILMRGHVKRDGLMLTGSTGQPVAHPLLGEISRHLSQLLALVKALKIPEEAVQGLVTDGSVSAKARTAANSRWAKAHGAAS